jgi:uncharacterized protein (TIGR00369 family)
MERPDYLPKPRSEWNLGQEPIPFLEHIGPIWRRVVDSQFEHCFHVQPFHINLFGYVHGGMIATFADHALGFPALMANQGNPIVTTHLDVNFVSGARLGELVSCKGEVVRKARSICFMRGDIMAEGRIVATASGVWKAIDR